MQELESVVGRAMRQAAQSLGAAEVPEDVFWYAKQVSDAIMQQLQLSFTCMTKTSLHEQERFDRPQLIEFRPSCMQVTLLELCLPV